MQSPAPERLISVDSHVDVSPSRSGLTSPPSCTICLRRRRRRVQGPRDRIRGEERKSVAQTWDHEAAGRPGLPIPMTTEGHGSRRRRGRGALLRALRVPRLPPDARRLERGARLQRLHGRVRGGDPKRLVCRTSSRSTNRLRGHEVPRLASIGAKSVHLPNYPTELGFPDYYDSATTRCGRCCRRRASPSASTSA